MRSLLHPRAGLGVMLLGELMLLGGCPQPGGPGGGNACFVDEECVQGEVCARDEICWPQGEVRFVKATWTVNGMAASKTTCASHPDLYIRFDGNVPDDLSFAPVPCEIGQFIVDRLPQPYTTVELRLNKRTPGRITAIGADGTAALDLPL